MRLQATRDTAPEMALRRELHGRGLRYYVHRRPLPGVRREADIVFPRAKVAVFVDGCWWHGCPEHGGQAKRNGAFWSDKIDGNRVRDLDTDERLAAQGWLSVRVWEHQPASLAATDVEETVRRRLRQIASPRDQSQDR
jgi:DNA mismatch endonuclease (patch repair protein)